MTLKTLREAVDPSTEITLVVKTASFNMLFASSPSDKGYNRSQVTKVAAIGENKLKVFVDETA